MEVPQTGWQLAGMGRRRRPYLPGGVFHLAARTLRRQRLLTPRIRGAALEVVAAEMPLSSARLLAAAIMPNHFHLLVQQGERPLSDLMQPVLRRLALRVQKEHGVEGPVFWRPYACQPCLDPDHARNAILYIHLNPLRAGLCAGLSDYPWTSHSLYSENAQSESALSDSPLARVLDPRHALPLFASGPVRRLDELRQDYRRQIAWRLDQAREATGVRSEAEPDQWRPQSANVTGTPWSQALSPLFHQSAGYDRRSRPKGVPAPAPDLATIARLTIAAEAPRVSLDMVRGRGGGLATSRLRREIIRRGTAAGHRNIDMARFLRISESAVSKVVRDHRTGPSVPR
jgi:putative transposase